MDVVAVSAAILRVGANSGQTFIKCRDITCDVGSTAVGKL